MAKKMKYAIDAELLPYCFKIPQFPKAVTPLMQKMLRVIGKKRLRDERLDVEIFKLDSGVQMFMLKPKNSKTRRAVYAIHGGGFVFPHAPYHIDLAKEYALRLDAKVFLIDYRVAPKYQYPVALDDCFEGLEFLLNNQERLGIDTDHLMIGGDSAGGYLAITTTLKMHEKYGRVPRGNFLMYPACDAERNS